MLRANTRAKIEWLLNQIVYVIGFISIFVFVLRIGFHLEEEINRAVFESIQFIVFIFCGQELLRWVLAKNYWNHLKERWFENFIVASLIFYLIRDDLIQHTIRSIHPNLGIDDITVAYLGITQIFLSFGQIIRIFRNANVFSRVSLTSSQIFTVSFMVPILIGAALLKLPKATHNGIDWIDAIFTATSAICVTGLTVLDTATDFTPLGQFIIIFLVQIGGLGIMTLSLSFGILFSGGLGLKERILMGDMLSEDRMGEIASVLGKITLFTFTAEGIGATLLYFSRGYTFENLQIRELYNAIFHAISAFCNSGFSLFVGGFNIPNITSNWLYCSIIMGLVIIGGIGFPVVLNIYEFFSFKKRRLGQVLLRTPTKIILITTACLLGFGTLFIWLAGMGTEFQGMTWQEQLFHSSFLSVISRSSGFNIYPTESLSVVTCIIIMFLMWIGGSPMSTAGGIKTLTFSVAVLAVKAIATGKNHIEVFGREIYGSSVFKAFTIIFVSIIVLFLGTIALLVLEPQASAFDLMFEAVSAFGTVGLSRGITANLSDPSKLLITILMFTGRIGFVTFLGSLFYRAQQTNYKLLKENIPIQ